MGHHDCNFFDGNNELQCYTNDTRNVRVADGNLVIKAIVEPKGNGKRYSSARIHGKNGFKYGRFEVRAKLEFFCVAINDGIVRKKYFR